MKAKSVNRREFLRLAAIGAAATVAASCAPKATPVPTAAPKAEAPKAEEKPTEAPKATAAPKATDAPKATEAPTAAEPATLTGELESFSWWTSGGEVEALNAIYAIYNRLYPDVKINNAALAGGQGQGGNMKALLETRMLGNQPPDSC